VPPGLDERPSQRFGNVKRQQQREPLARAAIPLKQAGGQQRERHRLEHQPRSVGAQRREHELPQRFKRHQRERAGYGEPRRAGGRVR